MTKFIKRGISFILAVVTALSLGISSSAAAYSAKWAVGRLSDAADDWVGWTGNGSSEFSAGTSSGSDIITIKNKDYNIAYVEKTFKVKPYTTYRFSAMVKYSGYALSSEAETKASGACVGKAYSYENSGYTTSKNWTKVEYTFTTGNETSINLCLQNGIYNGKCKGTAWFSNVKLEKAELTTEWNVLAVIYTNVNAKLKNPSTGKLTSVKKSLTQNDITAISNTLRNFRTSVAELSGNQMSIGDIDCIKVSDAITENELAEYKYDGDDYFDNLKIDGYRLEQSSDKVSALLDKYLAKKNYNHIIVFVPIDDYSGGWGGLDGTYKSYSFSQINCSASKLWTFKHGNFPECTLIHEMLHNLEHRTNSIKEKKAPHLHYATDFGYEYNSREWFKAYMQATLPGSKGIYSSVYSVPSGKYTLVSDDMSTGTGISGTISNTNKTTTTTTTTTNTTSSSTKIDITKLTISKISDRTYNGKEQKPAVKIKDGTYTLKSGTDYTVSYSNNKSVGKASAVVTGKGKYIGKITINFSIVPKAPTLKVNKSSGKLKLSWSKVSGATKYYIWLSMDGGKYTQVGVAESDTFNASMSYNSKHKYQFAISAYVPKAEGYTKYSYSDII